ncbi:MAG: hypothetical protein CW691_03210 [Candidatus Bathyarchaeum sp.]|nr:MAG: hypothetical protein CW691_03210 [Candidatus Bathyarchaeum sp.]
MELSQFHKDHPEKVYSAFGDLRNVGKNYFLFKIATITVTSTSTSNITPKIANTSLTVGSEWKTVVWGTTNKPPK